MSSGLYYKAAYHGSIVKGYTQSNSGSDGTGNGGCSCISLWYIFGGYLNPVSSILPVRIPKLVVTQSFNITSDLNMKTNIEDIPEYEVNKLSQLSGKCYNLKSDMASTRFGYIAQDMERVYPELVSTSPDSSIGIKSIDYIGLIPLIIEKLKRVEDRIDNLKL
jgi:hypothetical protein